MKVIVFFLYLFFVMLGVEQNSYANTQQGILNTLPTQNLTTDLQSKFTVKDQITTLIEDSDLDSDEEQIKNDSKKNRPDDKSIILKSGFINNWNVALSNSFCSDNYNHFKNNISFSKQPLPIYLKNRVLRI